MNVEELEKIVARHEMQCLELKESFNVECIDSFGDRPCKDQIQLSNFPRVRRPFPCQNGGKLESWISVFYFFVLRFFCLRFCPL